MPRRKSLVQVSSPTDTVTGQAWADSLCAQVIIADTAGRLPTQLHLLEQMKEARRVMANAMGGAPVLPGDLAADLLDCLRRAVSLPMENAASGKACGVFVLAGARFDRANKC